MKVLRVIARLNVGGPARHVVLLDRGLRARGHETLLVHGAVGNGEASLEHLAAAYGVPTLKVAKLGRRMTPFGDAHAFLQLLRAMFREAPDAVHTHTAKAGALGRIAAAIYNATRSRRRRCLVVHTFHGHVLSGYFGALGSSLARAAERALALLADRIVTISDRQREDIAVRYRIARPDKIVVVPLGLELDALLDLPPGPESREVLHLPLDATVIGFIGRLVPIKQPLLLIEAFAAVHAACPSTALLVVGDGELRSAVEADVRRRGLDGRVVLAGWREDLGRVYAAVDIVALSSRNEGTPVALIEAMAAARPAVAPSVGGVPDVITDGETGLLVPPADAPALADALISLVRRPDERRRLGRAGREGVLARYRASRLVDDIHELYERELLVRRGHRRAESRA